MICKRKTCAGFTLLETLVAAAIAAVALTAVFSAQAGVCRAMARTRAAVRLRCAAGTLLAARLLKLAVDEKTPPPGLLWNTASVSGVSNVTWRTWQVVAEDFPAAQMVVCWPESQR